MKLQRCEYFKYDSFAINSSLFGAILSPVFTKRHDVDTIEKLQSQLPYQFPPKEFCGLGLLHSFRFDLQFYCTS